MEAKPTKVVKAASDQYLGIGRKLEIAQNAKSSSNWKSCWKCEKLLKPQYQKFINIVRQFYSGSYLELAITCTEGTNTSLNFLSSFHCIGSQFHPFVKYTQQGILF